ncbi:Putative uncharacterized protein KLHL6 [Candida maltosa Xu316]|uniref:Uncharacterized protein n=1 Tax=Candida maltosa (strain Xu316) TaxID=1245528 RepID=M3IW19_CANMX|nr:Putative uncharacterized protein KLHL6 [Candida maltosa Xu316]
MAISSLVDVKSVNASSICSTVVFPGITVKKLDSLPGSLEICPIPARSKPVTVSSSAIVAINLRLAISSLMMDTILFN